MSRRGSNKGTPTNKSPADPPVMAENDATASVDLSKLFTFNPTALELVLKTVLTRLDNLEKSGAGDSGKQPKSNDGGNPAPGVSREELADLKDKLYDHNNRLNDLENPAKKRGLGDDEEDGSKPGTIGGWGDRQAKDFEDRLKGLEKTVNGDDGDANNSGAEDEAGGSGRGAAAALGMGELSRRVRRLEDTGATKEGDVKPLKDDHEDLKQKVDDLQKMLDDLKADNDKKANLDQLDDLADQLQDTGKEVDKLKELMDNAHRELEHLRTEHGKMQGRLGVLEGLTTLLNSKDDGGVGKELSSFSDTLGDIKGKQASAEADIEALQNALKNLEKTADGLDKDKEAAADADKKFKQLEDELGNLKQKQRDLEDAKAAGGAANEGAAIDTSDLATKPQVNTLGKRVDDLEKRIEGLARRSPAPAAVAAPAATANTAPAGSGADLTDLTNRLNDLASRHNGLQDSFDSFRKEARGDLANLQDGHAAQKKEISALGTECSKLSADLSKRLHDIRKLEDTKANKSDLDALKESMDKVVGPLTSGLNGLQSVKDQLVDTHGRVGEHNRVLTDLKNTLSTLQGACGALQNEKAGKDMVGHLSVDVTELSKKVQDLASMRPSNKNRGDAASEDAVRDLQSQLNQVIVGAATDKEWAKGQLVEIRATVEHIHHSKADASLVANKAERDYVENAMEKLMREVEQVLNTTNSGLIDTIDKSLNILRDMIDGKATKDDVNGLKKTMAFSQDGSGGGGEGAVPDGLMGYKGYRCLGCNRTMEGMRQRPMGSSFSSFMNRVPNNNRVPKPPLSAGGQQAITANAQGTPAGYLTAPPGSA